MRLTISNCTGYDCLTDYARNCKLTTIVKTKLTCCSKCTTTFGSIQVNKLTRGGSNVSTFVFKSIPVFVLVLFTSVLMSPYYPCDLHLYSPTWIVRTWIKRIHVLLEHILFPLPNSCLFRKMMYPFVEHIRRFNTHSSNCSLLLTEKKTPSPREIILKNLERLDRNLIFELLLQIGLATKGHNSKLNSVNNLPSGRGIKTINSCTDNRLNKQSCFINIVNIRAVAQSVERATPDEEVPGSIPAVATRSLLVGSVSV